MSLPLSDDRLDRVLAELSRSSGEEIAADAPTADEFADRLAGRHARLRRRPLLGSLTVARWQVAALLLLALAIAGSIVAGALLLRQTPPRLSLLPPHGLDCPPAGSPLAANEVVVVEGLSSGPYRVLDDGRIIGGSLSPVEAGEFGAFGRPLSRRGIDLVREEIAASGLVARGCHHDLLSDGPLRGVAVRAADGAVGATDWGHYNGFIRTMTEAERAAADLLVARLENLRGWLPPSAWRDDGARPAGDTNRAGLTATPQPDPSARTGNATAPAVPAIDPCRLLPFLGDLSNETTLGVLRGSEFQGNTGYTSCTSVLTGAGDYALAIRTAHITTTEAPALAHMWLGEDAARIDVAGRSAWMNTCMASPTAENGSCMGATALVAEPHFLILTVHNPVPWWTTKSADARTFALGLLPGVLERLAALDATGAKP